MRRLLIVGCGEVALRVVRYLRGRYRLYGLRHSVERQGLLRSLGITPLSGDLDDPDSLRRLAGLPHDGLHFVPPRSRGLRDIRTANPPRALGTAGSLPHRLACISASGAH